VDPDLLSASAAQARRVGGSAIPGHAPSMSFAQLILSGLFDRLRSRIFFAETRLGWVPFWMEEADYWYERHRHWAARLLNFQAAEAETHEYVREHIFFSVQHVERVRSSCASHGRRPDHVRDGLPPHRVRLAEHAPVRPSACSPTSRRRGVQDRGTQHGGVLSPEGTPMAERFSRRANGDGKVNTRYASDRSGADY